VLHSVARKLVDSCRGYRLFLDLVHLETFRPGLRAQSGVHPWQYLFDAIQNQPLLFPEHAPEVVPVTGLSRSQDYRQATIEIARASERLCVRLTRRDIQAKQLRDQLLRVTDAAGLHPPNVDIVVDLAILPRTDKPIRFLEHNFSSLNRWRSLTILAGSFPKDLRDFKPVGRHNRPREEWLYFDEQVLQSSDLGQVVAYGDYTIQHPIYSEPLRHPNPSASIRYAIDDSWIVMKGEALNKENGPGAKQWPAQAKVLTSFVDEFLGPQHCDGCRYISAMAQGTNGTGDCRSWIEAGINHAITVAARQARERIRKRKKRARPRTARDD
jgi:hypothetical protein